VLDGPSEETNPKDAAMKPIPSNIASVLTLAIASAACVDSGGTAGAPESSNGGTSTSDPTTPSAPSGKPGTSSANPSGRLVPSFGDKGTYRDVGDEVTYVVEQSDGMLAYCSGAFTPLLVPADGKYAHEPLAGEALFKSAKGNRCLALRVDSDVVEAIYGGNGGSALARYEALIPGDPPAMQRVWYASLWDQLNTSAFAADFAIDGTIWVGGSFFGYLGACTYDHNGKPLPKFVGGSGESFDECSVIGHLAGVPRGIVGRLEDAVMTASDTTATTGPAFFVNELSSNTGGTVSSAVAFEKLKITALGPMVRADGNKLLVLGARGIFPEADLVVLRFDSDLKPDETFGDYGVVALGRSDIKRLGHIALGPDGSIVVSATAGGKGAPRAVVARFLSHGKVDTSFAEGGSSVPMDFDSTGVAIGFTADGNMLLGGSRSDDESWRDDDDPYTVQLPGLYVAKLTY
jgi:hypothetical protein